MNSHSSRLAHSGDSPRVWNTAYHRSSQTRWTAPASAGNLHKSRKEIPVTAAEPPSTVPAMLAGLVAKRGDHDAIVMMSETVSYGKLSARSAQLARALLAAGAGKGAR